MKLSELKEQIKELYLQEENSVEDIEAQTKATQDLTAATKELNKVTMSEFKNYLRNEILAEIAEEDEEVSDNIEVDLAIDDENIDYKKANIYEFDKEWKGSDGVINDNDYFYIV